MDSVCRTLMRELPRGDKTRVEGYINLQSGPRIAEARSLIVENFLNSPQYAAADWLWMVDSDMVFEADTLERLIEAADPVDRPLMGALCFAGYSPETMYPTIYSMVPENETWALEKVHEYPRDALLKVGATGAAMLLAHRSVLLRMYQAFHTLPNGKINSYPWFVEGHVDHEGRQLGEDIAFCIRAQGLGIPVHIHTGIKIGHRKNIILDERVYEERMELEKYRANDPHYKPRET